MIYKNKEIEVQEFNEEITLLHSNSENYISFRQAPENLNINPVLIGNEIIIPGTLIARIGSHRTTNFTADSKELLKYVGSIEEKIIFTPVKREDPRQSIQKEINNYYNLYYYFDCRIKYTHYNITEIIINYNRNSKIIQADKVYYSHEQINPEVPKKIPSLHLYPKDKDDLEFIDLLCDLTEENTKTKAFWKAGQFYRDIKPNNPIFLELAKKTGYCPKESDSATRQQVAMAIIKAVNYYVHTKDYNDIIIASLDLIDGAKRNIIEATNEIKKMYGTL